MEPNVECDSTSTGGTFSPWLWQVFLNCLHFSLCLEVGGCRFAPEFVTTYHVRWGTCVDCSVVIILAEYVLCLQFKNAVDNFPLEQGSWKADIRSSSQEIPSFNGKWTFISELKSACHWGPLYTVLLYIYIYIYIVCEPCISQLQMLLL